MGEKEKKGASKVKVPAEPVAEPLTSATIMWANNTKTQALSMATSASQIVIEGYRGFLEAQLARLPKASPLKLQQQPEAPAARVPKAVSITKKKRQQRAWATCEGDGVDRTLGNVSVAAVLDPPLVKEELVVLRAVEVLIRFGPLTEIRLDTKHLRFPDWAPQHAQVTRFVHEQAHLARKWLVAFLQHIKRYTSASVLALSSPDAAAADTVNSRDASGDTSVAPTPPTCDACDVHVQPVTLFPGLPSAPLVVEPALAPLDLPEPPAANTMEAQRTASALSADTEDEPMTPAAAAAAAAAAALWPPSSLSGFGSPVHETSIPSGAVTAAARVEAAAADAEPVLSEVVEDLRSQPVPVPPPAGPLADAVSEESVLASSKTAPAALSSQAEEEEAVPATAAVVSASAAPEEKPPAEEEAKPQAVTEPEAPVPVPPPATVEPAPPAKPAAPTLESAPASPAAPAPSPAASPEPKKLAAVATGAGPSAPSPPSAHQQGDPSSPQEKQLLPSPRALSAVHAAKLAGWKGLAESLVASAGEHGGTPQRAAAGSGVPPAASPESGGMLKMEVVPKKQSRVKAAAAAFSANAPVAVETEGPRSTGAKADGARTSAGNGDGGASAGAGAVAGPTATPPLARGSGGFVGVGRAQLATSSGSMAAPSPTASWKAGQRSAAASPVPPSPAPTPPTGRSFSRVPSARAGAPAVAGAAPVAAARPPITSTSASAASSGGAAEAAEAAEDGSARRPTPVRAAAASIERQTSNANAKPPLAGPKASAAKAPPAAAQADALAAASGEDREKDAERSGPLLRKGSRLASLLAVQAQPETDSDDDGPESFRSIKAESTSVPAHAAASSSAPIPAPAAAKPVASSSAAAEADRASLDWQPDPPGSWAGTDVSGLSSSAVFGGGERKEESSGGPSSFVKRMASQVEKRTVDDGPASFRSIDGTNEGPPPAKARSEAAAPHGAYAAANAQPCDLVDFPSPLFLLAADLMMAPAVAQLDRLSSVGRLNAAKAAPFMGAPQATPPPEAPLGPGSVTLRSPEQTSGRRSNRSPQMSMR